MDNKQHNRQSSVPPKGPANDGRKDNGGGQKQQARFQRRVDPGNRARNESTPGRKSAPQRSREFDNKRPRARGNYQNDRPRPEMTEERRAESGSALRPGSKKGNLNHLLNFTFAPRDSDNMGRGGAQNKGAAGWKNKNKWAVKSNLKYNKERFLQANCQFVVRENADYSVHAADPDTLVDWARVEQVRTFSHQVSSCPICLYPPVAAKMTRCGHIYCWSCILHYLSLEDKSWRKCPICYESIYKKDLKSVVALEKHQFRSEQQITMKLMKRWRGSTFAMPKKQWTDRGGKPHNLADTVDVRFAKLLLANCDQVKEILAAEKRELQQQLSEEGDSLEGSFVQAALQLLKDREDINDVLLEKTSFQEKESANSDQSGSSSGDEVADKPPCVRNENAIRYLDAFNDEINTTGEERGEPPEKNTDDAAVCEDTGATNNNEAKKENLNEAAEEDKGEEKLSVEEATNQLAIPMEPEKRTTGNQTTETYYFYQAEDGQHIYLHSINARCLVQEFGSWEACPDTITANIVELEGVSMSEELRRRLRYLSHLPVTCEFQVAELALRPPLVSRETLSDFSDEVEKRRRMRQKRLREERQRARKIQVDENKKIGIYPGMHINISSQHHFPGAAAAASSSPPPREGSTGFSVRSASESDLQNYSSPVGSPPLLGLNPDAIEFKPGSPASIGSSEDGQQSSSVSFAQMLRAGKAKPSVEAWPRTARQCDAGAVSATKPRDGSDDSDCEDKVPVPVFQSSFGDAIEQALNKFKQLDVDVEDAVVSAGVSSVGGKKKKGKKQQLLFTTSMRRNDKSF